MYLCIYVYIYVCVCVTELSRNYFPNTINSILCLSLRKLPNSREFFPQSLSVVQEYAEHDLFTQGLDLAVRLPRVLEVKKILPSDILNNTNLSCESEPTVDFQMNRQGADYNNANGTTEVSDDVLPPSLVVTSHETLSLSRSCKTEHSQYQGCLFGDG